jgi:amino acid transporter
MDAKQPFDRLVPFTPWLDFSSCHWSGVWSIQEAAITTELSTAYPEASGSVAWAEEAFGPFSGWMVGYLGWIAGVTDNAIYPVLLLDYVLQIWTSEADEIHGSIRFSLLAAMSISLAYVNWLGLSIVGNMSVLIAIFAMSPFVILTIMGAFQVDPRRWLQMPSPPEGGWEEDADGDGIGFFSGLALDGVLWRPFLNTIFWSLNSFDSAASFAGEVVEPGRIIPKAMFWAVLTVVASYFLPLLITLGASSDSQHEWVDGYLATIASEIGGPWLEDWIVLAAGVSNIALFQADMSAESFLLLGMAERGHVPKVFATRS